MKYTEGKKYYSSGEFAGKAHVSLRTVRYYDRVGLLHPSLMKESGARLYTDQDFARMQQILLFKYLGFSLDEIREMTVASADPEYLLNSLHIQKKLLQERMEEIREMSEAIDEMTVSIEADQPVQWDEMIDRMHLSSMERSLRTQYVNAANISSRITLHSSYSVNPQGWFPWVMEQCGLMDGQNVLEVGCGNGELWKENLGRLPKDLRVILTDLSDGMIRDVRNTLLGEKVFSYRVFDCQNIPYEADAFDRVIANHVLFYCEDVAQAIRECARVLKDDGIMICSTYGKKHMKEVTELVQEFNPEIVLSAERLYDRFGLENGRDILSESFFDIVCRKYEDEIFISKPEPLISYILSCHGNQNRLLIDHYREFKEFVSEKVQGGFHITKDAGVFLCRK